jgi:hypothetical protein
MSFLETVAAERPFQNGEWLKSYENFCLYGLMNGCRYSNGRCGNLHTYLHSWSKLILAYRWKVSLWACGNYRLIYWYDWYMIYKYEQLVINNNNNNCSVNHKFNLIVLYLYCICINRTFQHLKTRSDNEWVRSLFDFITGKRIGSGRLQNFQNAEILHVRTFSKTRKVKKSPHRNRWAVLNTAHLNIVSERNRSLWCGLFNGLFSFA